MSAIKTIKDFKMFRGVFDPRPIEAAHLGSIVGAARMAPSGHNSQPCEFLVIDDKKLIDKIATRFVEIWDDYLVSDSYIRPWLKKFDTWMRWSAEDLENQGDGVYMKGVPGEAWNALQSTSDEAELHKSVLKFFGFNGKPMELICSSPCLIITLVNKERQAPDNLNNMHALLSAGAAMQNMRLTARELGIVVHEQSQFYDAPASRLELKKALGLPENIKVVGAMRVGYRPARKSGSKVLSFVNSSVRRPLSKIAHRNSYGNYWD